MKTPVKRQKLTDMDSNTKESRSAKSCRDLIVYRIIKATRLENVPNLHYIRNYREGLLTVAPYMHDVVVDRIRSLVRFYKLSPSSFFLSVSILDKFLSIVKVRAQHLMCATVAAFYMAVKMIEPKENVMTVKHLVRISQCGCLPNDVSRMEAIIADKVNARDYDVPASNHFLQLFVSYCQMDGMLHFLPEEFSMRFFKLLLKLEACHCHFALLQFRPCVLALSLLSHELPGLIAQVDAKHQPKNLSWIKVIWELQRIAQITGFRLPREVFQSGFSKIIVLFNSKINQILDLHITKSVMLCPQPVNFVWASQISDTELLYCRSQVADCLRRYSTNTAKPSFSKLVWVVSTRTARVLHYTSKLAHHLPTIPECSSWRPEQDDGLLYDPSMFGKDCHIYNSIQNLSQPVMLGNPPLQDATNTQLYCMEPKRTFNYHNSQLQYCPVNSPS